MNLKKTYETIKNNLPIIILLPTILGGLWQLIELASLSFSFLRFFSITQLLPDGLLILTMLILLYIAYYFGINKYKFKYHRKILNLKIKKPKDANLNFIKNTHSNKLIYIENPIYRKSLIIFDLLIVIFLPLIFYYLFNPNDFQKDFNFLIFVFVFYFMVLILNIFLSSLFVLFIHFIESRIFNKMKETIIIKKFLSIVMKTIFLSIVILVILFPIKVASFFHENYLLPQNLKNLEYLDKILKNKDYDSNKILYFNDKYIFIEHKKDKNKSVEIIKFNELFKNDTYNVIINKE